MSAYDITKGFLYIKKLINVIRSENKNHHKLLTVNGRHSDALVYILSGSCTYNFEDGDSVNAKGGDILYLSHHAVYEMYIHDENYRFIFCDFEFDCDQPRRCRVFTPKSPSAIENLFSKLFNVHRSGTPSATAEATSILYRIYSQLISLEKEAYINRSVKEKILAAKEHIDACSDDPTLSVRSLADMAGISEVYFRTLFRSEFGCTPVRYIITLRLKKAKQLLNYPFLSIEECAAGSGFSSLHYFCRVFKKELGLTPSEYRRIH